MALSTQTSEWLEGLKKDGGLTDEAFNALKTSLEGNSKADEYVKGSQLRQADYSRQMTDLQKAQKEAADAQAKLTEREAGVTKFQEELGAWKKGADVNYQKAIQEREQAAKKAASAVARLKSLAMANGISEDEVLKDLDVTTTTVNEPDKKVDVDLSGYLKKEDAQRAMAESALIDAAIYDLSQEYLELTGKPLRGAALLVQEALTARKPLSQYVAEKFKFGELRDAKSNADVQRRIDEAVAAERTKILSDSSLGGGMGSNVREDLHGSPILTGGPLKAPTSEGGGGVSAAVAAFNQGKFKVGK